MPLFGRDSFDQLPEPTAEARKSALAFTRLVNSYILAGLTKEESIHVVLELIRIDNQTHSHDCD